MKELRIKINTKLITLDDLIALEEGSKDPKWIREFLGKLAVDEKGEFLGVEEGVKVTGKLTIPEVGKAFDQVRSFWKDKQDDAISPLAEDS